MIAEITLDNIFSGFVGAVCGILASIGITWWNAHRIAKELLRQKLLSIKTFYFADIDGKVTDAFQVFRTTYPDILAAYLAYKSLLPFEMQCEVSRAWNIYRGEDISAIRAIKYLHSDVNSEMELETRIDALLSALD